jgi:GDPmannose 4,6-dehydratase
MTKRAFITGIAGQDGSYLAEHLLEQNYEVYGILRRNSVIENQQTRLSKFENQLHNVYGDMLDQSSIEHALEEAKPDEIYNLAAQSHVRISFDVPQFTAQTNALGVLNLLEAARQVCPKARIYQASSSEMFGNSVDADGKQRETTPMHPVSPYGCAKLYAYHMMRTYRNSYKMFAANGILMNHESPRRGSNFVTNKIVKNAVLISVGRSKELVLGNLDASRDWGHSYDYVRAMRLILQQERPDDFLIATGETRTVRDFCEIAFNKLGLDYRQYVRQDPKFMRPQELNYLCGDSTKSRTVLGWKPTYTFEQMVDEMIDFWLTEFSREVN